MAGGTWLSQTKVRPGAYLNFLSVPRPTSTIGDRGIGIIALPLSWGAQGELIDVYSEDLLTGDSLAKVGFTAFDGASKLLGGMLSYCYLARVYRTNTGGFRAAGQISGLTVTAKYTGTFGNSILISIVAEGAFFIVNTFVSGALKDEQKIAVLEDLEPNDFVTFSGTGVPVINAGTTLEDGADGTITEETAYAQFQKLAETSKWQTMAVTSTSETVKKVMADFIETQRNKEGRYVQAAIANYDPDFEGVINCGNSAVIFGETFTTEEFTAVVAGMTAGASVTESNTGRVINGATQIIGEMNNSQIIAALRAGKFVLSTNQDGAIKVEQDINSLHTFVPEKGYPFSKNRVIRILDEIGIFVRSVWERSFMGRVNNNDDGRAVFKSNVMSHIDELQNIGAIQNFGGADDMEVSAGNEIDAVLCNLWVQPVDAMEKLYMNVHVIG